jgi:hypothetical protein
LDRSTVADIANNNSSSSDADNSQTSETSGYTQVGAENNDPATPSTDYVSPREWDRHHIEQLMFQRNGTNLDPINLLYGYQKTLNKKHDIYLIFSAIMCDALLMVSEEDLNKENEKLTAKLASDPNSRFFQNDDGAKKEA